MLPTVNPNLVPSLEAFPDYYDDSDSNQAGNNTLDAGDDIGCSDDILGSPDDGFESGMPSSDAQQSTPATEANSQDTNVDNSSQAVQNSIPQSTDEGISETPNNTDDSPGKIKFCLVMH